MSAQPQAGQAAHPDPEKAGRTDLIEHAPLNETSKDTKPWIALDTADFWQLSTFDKLGAVFQVSTVVLCILLCPTGLVDSFRSDFTNCDDKAPFPQAVLSAILALCLCSLAGGVSSAIGTARIKITEWNGLTPDARERRRVRAPRYLLAAVVPGQFLAALMLGQTAYRTAQADLSWSPVPVLAIVAFFACMASGLWNAILALLIHRTTWSPVDLKVSEEKSNNETVEESSNDQSWLFDTTLQSFLSLPTLDRTAVLANPLALASGLAVILTTSALLWTEPCGTKERKALMEASDTATQVVCATLSMHMTIVPVLQFRAGQPFKGEKPKRWAVGFPAVFFCIHGGLLVALAYMMRTSTYGLQLVRAQECIAAVMYFTCGVCNFKLMLDTNFNEPLPQEETVEADAGTRNE